MSERERETERQTERSTDRRLFVSSVSISASEAPSACFRPRNRSSNSSVNLLLSSRRSDRSKNGERAHVQSAAVSGELACGLVLVPRRGFSWEEDREALRQR